jgi:hypothetical protein
MIFYFGLKVLCINNFRLIFLSINEMAMAVIRIASISILFFLCFSTKAFAEETKIFEIIKMGDLNALRTYLDTSKTSVNIVNSKGYTPLHVLIENYIEAKPELEEGDSYKYQQAVAQQKQYYACLQLLLDHGASSQKLTP